jgi:hypothetical protein
MSVDVKIHIFDDRVLSINDLEIFFSYTLGSKYFDLSKEISLEEDNRIWQKIGNTESICIEEVMDSFSPRTKQILALINEDLPTIDDNLVTKLKELDTDVGIWASNFHGKKLFWVSW